jgi:mannonate dehydratase
MSAPVTIKDVKTIMTEPPGIRRLIVVKIITSEDGLYGLGCATFTQRFRAVHTAIEEHLKPALIGRDVDRIEETWQQMMVGGYWRNGPVFNNAISGVDQALWDIKGKRAGMPVYQLLGGKCREAADCYTHAGGDSPQAVVDNMRERMAEGYRYLRLDMGGQEGGGGNIVKPEGAPEGSYYNPRGYVRGHLKMLEYLRQELGPEIEVMIDVHERLRPSEAVSLAKAAEQFDLFFLEDPLAPEDIDWFRNIRQVCSTPIAMGELFNHPLEWRPLIQDRLIDFIRMHVSQMGGITPARNVAAFADIYGVRTAWHGPSDTSPVGHAANLHLDLCAPNFGIQEWCRFSEEVCEMFPGTPEVRNGYMYPNDNPGLGIDVDEKLAAKYPCTYKPDDWGRKRLPDGTPVRP